MSATVLIVAKAPVAGLAKTRLTPPATPRQAARIAATALLDTLDAAQATGWPVVVALTGRLADAERAAELHAALRRTTVLSQRGATFADRLANAHADAAALTRLATGTRFGTIARLAAGTRPVHAWDERTATHERDTSQDLGPLDRTPVTFMRGDTAAPPRTPVLLIGMDTPQVTADMLIDAGSRLAGMDAVLGPATDGGWWALGLTRPAAADVLRAIPTSRPDTGERTLHALRRKGLSVGLLPELSDVDTMADAVRVAAEAQGTRFRDAVAEVAVR